MFKNTASQKVTLLVIDTSTNTPKTGDAANLTAYVSKDDGSVTVLGDTSATELDATNAPGLYSFDLTQSETNADKLLFSGKSTTANIKMIPLLLYATPASFTSFTTPPTVAQIATGVWQDTTSGDFTVSSSIGKSLYTSGVAPGGSGGLFIAGSNAATTISGLTTGALSCTTITASGAVAFQSTFAVTTSTSLAALSCTTLTASGAVVLQSTFAVTGTTTLTGAVTASHASNNIVGVSLLAGSFVTATFGTCDLTSTMKTSVNTEVLDVIAVDTTTQPSAVLSATPTIREILTWLGTLNRNKRSQTSATETLYADNGTTVVATSSKSDDGATLIRGEWT